MAGNPKIVTIMKAENDIANGVSMAKYRQYGGGYRGGGYNGFGAGVAFSTRRNMVSINVSNRRRRQLAWL
jgi:hypothetical protein